MRIGGGEDKRYFPRMRIPGAIRPKVTSDPCSEKEILKINLDVSCLVAYIL
jgi:hypothetical protein